MTLTVCVVLTLILYAKHELKNNHQGAITVEEN